MHKQTILLNLKFRNVVLLTEVYGVYTRLYINLT